MYCSSGTHRFSFCLDSSQFPSTNFRVLRHPKVLPEDLKTDETSRPRREGASIVSQLSSSQTAVRNPRLNLFGSTQFMETLDGLVTIRAFNWGRPSIEHNFEVVDRSQKPTYLMWAIKRWLALVLDLVITGIAVLTVGIVVGLRDDSSPGFTGVSLTQIISFTSNIKLLIMFWTQLESSLGAVARIRHFEEEVVAEDEETETHDPAFDWPSRGSIEISNVSAKYKSVFVLRKSSNVQR